MKIDPRTMTLPPSTSSSLELMCALLHEAEIQPATESGRFRAMDCHSDIATLALEGYSLGEEFMRMRGRIGANQIRLGIMSSA